MHEVIGINFLFTDGGVEGLTTFKLAVIIGTNAGALMLCLAIAVIIYKICRKGEVSPVNLTLHNSSASEVCMI